MRAADLEGFRHVPQRPLVDRLRDVGETTPICKEAAAEIQRLVADLAQAHLTMGREFSRLCMERDEALHAQRKGEAR